MNYAIILAGGSGSRFWPVSRQSEPKQFLNICSEKSQIAETIRRISPLIKKERIYIAANRIHKQKIKKCAKDYNIPAGNLFFEPQSKNTLAPIAALSAIIYNLDREAVVAIFPSDHYVRDKKRFLGLAAEGIAAAKGGCIITFGMPPVRPEAGYGYIKIKAEKPKSRAYMVEGITEKPSPAKAKRFARDKRYYWNSGIFIFRPQIMLNEIRRLAPRAYEIIMRIKNKRDCLKFWHKFPSISIDYAIMEKTDTAAVLPADCGWADLGSWQAITELMKTDKKGNTFRGRCLDIGSKNTFVWSGGRLIATLGLEDMIVVDTEDALLVCPKDRTQEVKKIVQVLKKNNFKKHI